MNYKRVLSCMFKHRINEITLYLTLVTLLDTSDPINQ